ncbi:hypothetical protein D3C80_763070 [compost metagenome]
MGGAERYPSHVAVGASETRGLSPRSVRMAHPTVEQVLALHPVGRIRDGVSM